MKADDFLDQEDRGCSKSSGGCVRPHEAVFPESARRRGQEGCVRTQRGLSSLDLTVFIFLLPVPAALAPSAAPPPETSSHHSCLKDCPAPEPARRGPESSLGE